MRSRYAAYVLEHEGYLLETWHPETRPTALDLSAGQKWLGLKVLRSEQGNERDDAGLVEFNGKYARITAFGFLVFNQWKLVPGALPDYPAFKGGLEGAAATAKEKRKEALARIATEEGEAHDE